MENLLTEVPSLRQLKLVVKLELQARGGDAPIWRVQMPEVKVERDPAGDARINVVVQRQRFNDLAEEGTLREWARAYERGLVKVTGEPAVVKLLGNALSRHLARSRS